MGTGLKGKIVLQNALLGARPVCIHTSSGFMMVCERATGYKRLSILQPRKDFLIALELRVFKGPRDVLREYIGILGNTFGFLP